MEWGAGTKKWTSYDGYCWLWLNNSSGQPPAHHKCGTCIVSPVEQHLRVNVSHRHVNHCVSGQRICLASGNFNQTVTWWREPTQFLRRNQNYLIYRSRFAHRLTVFPLSTVSGDTSSKWMAMFLHLDSKYAACNKMALVSVKQQRNISILVWSLVKLFVGLRSLWCTWKSSGVCNDRAIQATARLPSQAELKEPVGSLSSAQQYNIYVAS